MPYQKPPNICPVCQREADFKFIQDYKNEKEEWSLCQCSECQVQFWVPFKSPNIEHYERNYIVRETMEPKLLYGYHKEFLKQNMGLPESARVLDLGCGTGDLLAILQKKGYEVWGADIDKNAINFAKKYFNLKNVYAMSCEDFFKLPDLPKFDLIMFFELFEHLDNPSEFIQNVKKILKEDGVIVLSTPSRERFLVNLWNADFPPHHLTRWNEKTISNIFGKINFKIDRIVYTDKLKFLFESLNDKLRLGLVLKVAQSSKSPQINDAGVIGGTFITRIVHFGAYLKDYILTGIPAIFLLLYGKLTSRKNGDMLIWLKRF